MIPVNRRQSNLSATMLVMALALLLTLAVACGDDDGGSNGDTNGTVTSTPAPSPTDGNGGDTPSPTQEVEDPTPTPTVAGERGALRALIQGWLDGIDGMVEYRYVSDFGQHPDGVYTMYQLGDSSRHDWFNEGSGLGATVVTIAHEDSGYVCTLSAGSASCLSTDPEQAVATRVVILIVYITLENIVRDITSMVVSELPGEEIAGVNANCYEVSSPGRITEGPAGTEELKLCFSDDGNLLLVDHIVLFETGEIAESTLLLEAQETGDVTPDVFEPPAPVNR